MVIANKTALEYLWKGKCTIYVKQESVNQTNKRTKFVEHAVYIDQPCKLSFASIKQAMENTNTSKVTQVVKLFISNVINIPAGSKIIVTQNGVTNEYQNSGEPAVYTNHQEIILELFKGWS